MEIRKLTTNHQILTYLGELKQRKQFMISLDIEGEFNLHRYGEHLCLVQIFDGIEEVIIDPLVSDNREGLTELFTERDLLKIMYDSSSDSSLIKQVLGHRIRSILDLRPAVGLLDYPANGLSAVLAHEFNFENKQKKKFQQYNWMRRPLAPEAVNYAMNDVRMLFKLKDRLFEKLQQEKLFDLYLLKNLSVQNGTIKPMDKERWKKAKGYSKLPSERKIFFQKLFQAREEIARKADLPPNSVYLNRKMMDIAYERNPETFPLDSAIRKRMDQSLKAELLEAFSLIIKEYQNR